MIRIEPSTRPLPAALLRLSRLAPLDDADLSVLKIAADRSRDLPARRELLTEGRGIGEPLLVLDGVAARICIFADGRRQFLSFLLPGDMIGMCRQPAPLATSTVVTLSPTRTCAVPSPASSRLADAYAVSHALDEAYLLRHVRRLGRLSAQARIGDFLLEMHERLTMAGLVRANAFDLPFTQEVLADALGLTSVHVNRMLQMLRRSGDLDWKTGRVTLPDPARLADKVGRSPVRVSAQ